MPQTIKPSQGQIGSLVVSGLFILLGFLTLYDTTGYSDRDSQVFPQTVAVILIITASISLVMRFLKPDADGGFGQGIWWRRVLMVAGMFATCIAMPYIGFLAAGAIAFVSGLIAAMHDRWTPIIIALYFGSGAAIMIAFFALFKYALHVPLP